MKKRRGKQEDDRERITRLWMRQRADELAYEDGGCWFAVERGAWTVWWIERYCRLYEGESAGEPLLLRSGCEELDHPIAEDWDDGGRELSLERARKYIDWYHSGLDSDGNQTMQVDWQYDCTMRMFGWVVYDPHWGRNVRRFKQASIWIPKKQKKSPTLAAWGNYLTCGDGERGGKSFVGAKDGKQAGIAMRHALEMVWQSDELGYECKINKNERSIEHIPTRSRFEPLSSANVRTKTSKEGLNGNVLIDETHVVDRDFIDMISRTGISRAEAMRIDVSTAGNNPDGYGKYRQDLARQVREGSPRNDQLFVAIYEAPQDLSDAELDNDPLKYARMANPAWGHTAYEKEYLADYNESKASISELANHKMYRLNIWQQTANQWLRLDQWLRCGDAEMREDDLAGGPAGGGRACSAGLDFSKTRDMTALAVAVPVGKKVAVFCRLWMTEKYLHDNKDKADFQQWVKDGWLVEIPGDTIQEAFVREAFKELNDTFKLKVLVKDPYMSADFTEWVEEKYKRVDQIDYPQSNRSMEKPIDDFEAAVNSEELIHNMNVCLNWQAGHCSVHESARGDRILKKPKRDDYRKIDGMVASVMAYWGTKHLPKKRSSYGRRGVLTV